MIIWIDLENTPHALFFPPIIARLKELGDRVLVTARDCSQTVALFDLTGIPYRKVGKQVRGPVPIKAAGVLARAARLAVLMRGKPIDLSLSHSSRSHVLASRLLGIPVVTLLDYEYVAKSVFTRFSAKILAPEAIPAEAILPRGRRPLLVGYPGFKEQVYATPSPPDRMVARKLQCADGDVVALVRPPATRAHYHHPASDAVFTAVLRRFREFAGPLRVLLLPRYAEQAEALKRSYPEERFHVLDIPMAGPALLSIADLVVSGGGTMVREAAAMGIPAYSVFQGRMGAVDASLVRAGRVVHLKTETDADHLAIRKRTEHAGLQNASLVEFLVREIRAPRGNAS